MRFKRLDGGKSPPTSPPANGRARPAATPSGPRGAFVPWIGGSYSNVVGLPLTETLGLLAAAGITPEAATASAGR